MLRQTLVVLLAIVASSQIGSTLGVGMAMLVATRRQREQSLKRCCQFLILTWVEKQFFVPPCPAVAVAVAVAAAVAAVVVAADGSGADGLAPRVVADCHPMDPQEAQGHHQ